MAFRQTYSRVENSVLARAEFSLDIALVINGLRLGRIQSLSISAQTQARPAIEIGSDRAVEFVPGIKQYQGRISSMMLKYGDLAKRLASVSGGIIDATSRAATITNMPEFDIVIARRGSAGTGVPQLYADAQGPQDNSGSGGIIGTIYGCVLNSWECNITAQDTLIMENASFSAVDQTLSDGGGFIALP
jgi:hypothetical protein